MTSRYVLDTSAILAFTGQEEGAEQVERLLDEANSHKTLLEACSISLMELYYIAFGRQGQDEALRLVGLVKSWPLALVYPDEKTLLQAGKLKASYRLSVADALIAAVAKRRQATLVHKDPEFLALDQSVTLLTLPFKQGTGQ